MALWNFRHFKIVSNISQKRFDLGGLKLGQLIGDDEWITWLNKKKDRFIFRTYGPLKIWAL